MKSEIKRDRTLFKQLDAMKNSLKGRKWENYTL